MSLGSVFFSILLFNSLITKKFIYILRVLKERKEILKFETKNVSKWEQVENGER